jgi:hypothetical protein
MKELTTGEMNKCELIFDFYDKICINKLLDSEKEDFITSACDLSHSINEGLSKILDVCYEFAYRFYKIGDLCNFAKSSILLSRAASL